jgi:gliding motility-associated-like protein
VCATSTTLAGNNPGAGTTGQWTVVSGTGTFTDASLYNTTVSSLGSGTNVFQWTLTNSCGAAFDQVSIISSTPQSISPASSNPTLCVNTTLSPSITFTTTGATGIGSATGLPAGVTASWFGNTITISGTPTASGTFNYSIPLLGGCGAVNATGTITVVALPVITLTPDDPNTCNATDGSILVSGTGSGTITWTGPTSGSASSSLNYTITTLGAGTYSVYFTNASGCQSATVQTSLANPGAPQINIISDVTNCGTSYTLPVVPFVPGTENNPQYYTGPNGTGTVVAVGTVYNAPTNLTLYAYDVNGACTDEEPFVITINEIPSLDPLTAVSGCPGSSINPTDFSSTPAGATFSWTNDNITVGIPSIGNGQIATYNAPANATNTDVIGTVTVTPTLNGCNGSSSSFTITILPTPTINAITNVSGCPGSVADPADFVSAPAGATFSWSNSNANIGLVASGTDQITPFNLATNNTASAITGTISATATLNGCTSAPLTFTISINPTPVITLTPTDPSSCNGTDGSVLVNTGAPGSVSWSGTSTGTSGPMNSNYSITNLGAGSYDVTFTNSSTGCQSAVVSTSLLNPGAPIINPIADITQCGGSYTLPAISGTSLINPQYYTQPNGGGGIVSEGTLFEPDTVITLYAYDANGACTATESFTVSIYTLPTASISGGANYCEGDNILDISATITFGISNYTLNYTLNGVAQTQSGSTTSLSLGNTAGTYVLLSISDANCTNSNLSSTQTIVINAIPSAPSAGADTLYCDNASPVPLFAQGSGSFTWYSDENLTNEIGTNSSLTPSMNVGTTSYYVTETINGCEGPASVVVISVEECGIIVPTAFTPDGDQTNDTWTLQNIDQVYPNNVVNIYNRWGNLIYQSKKGQYETKPWDGKYNDENMPVGSYYFVIEYNDNYTDYKSGIVTLIK